MSKIILTEKRNPNSLNIDILSTKEIVEIINKEDESVAKCVKKEINQIAEAVNLIELSFLKGGHLLYFGAGTSGRLGVLDASECPPTFGVDPEMVRGYIAGGNKALRTAIEGAEDNLESGKEDLISAGVKPDDIVIGISASGNAPYVLGVLSKAQELNIKTVGIACNKQAKLKDHSHVFISPEVGEEVITGSTRMKSGTAQKMILNMLTTASMIRIGKTYENLMVDLRPTNIKLIDRAIRIVSEIAEVDYNIAEKMLNTTDFDVKTAIIILFCDVNLQTAKKILERNNGRLRESLKNAIKKED